MRTGRSGESAGTRSGCVLRAALFLGVSTICTIYTEGGNIKEGMDRKRET